MSDISMQGRLKAGISLLKWAIEGKYQ